VTVMAQIKHDKSSDLFIALARLSVVAIIATMSIVVMLRVVDHFRPQVGDIISFYPIKAAPPDTETKLEVTPAGTSPARPCLLDVRAMRMSGGSLIIEAVGADSRFAYRVHWAGGPTSDARTSCGTSAEVMLSPEEIGVLKMAAIQ
jgi:hypothetical protein